MHPTGFQGGESAYGSPESAQLVQADKQPSVHESLWQAAYDHPVATGFAVAGSLALAGAALYLTRGRIAGLLARKPGVLLIEDSVPMAKAMRFALEEQGHKVSWFTGIKQLRPFTALTPEGSEVALDAARLGRKFPIALLDGDLGKASLTGPEIAGTLQRNHIATIGTSTVDSFNVGMRENGAVVTANKPIIFTSLANRTLDLRSVLKTPNAVQSSLDAFRASYLKPENAASRDSAEALLKRFL